MVNRGVDFMLENALGSLMRSGMDPNMLQLDWGKLREELRPKATLEVRGQLLLEAVAKEEKLDVVKKQYQSAEARESLKNRTKEEKVIAFLKQHAKA